MTYQRRCDISKTCLLDDITAKKCDCRVECLGAYDELNSFLGIAAQFDDKDKIGHYIASIQNDIFTVCAEIAALPCKGKEYPKITAAHVKEIENAIERTRRRIKLKDSFVIPGGTKLSAMLDYARTISRRAEREMIRLKEETKLSEDLLRYANRISDLLYHLARLANKEVKEGTPVYRHFQ
ncbi:MAG: cob(I)yrinic acid a,c-diamide adenosyltransferase [Candidatus Woesearchaeota archaeon]